MKILILGAAGQIGRLLTKELLNHTDNELVLYARHAESRLENVDSERVSIVDGEFTDHDRLVIAMKDVDLIYLNDMNSRKGVETIVNAMNEVGCQRVIAASILGIYDEVPGPFGQWNIRMVGESGIQNHKETAGLIEIPDLDYTILRLTWLYNQKGNTAYHLTYKGQPFEGAQVTREAVTQLIVDIINEKSSKFVQTSIGVGEPDTNWDKPAFY